MTDDEAWEEYLADTERRLREIRRLNSLCQFAWWCTALWRAPYASPEWGTLSGIEVAASATPN